MSRRRFLKRTAWVLGGSVAAGGGWLWLAPRPPVQGVPDLAFAHRQLDQWQRDGLPALGRGTQGWSSAMMLVHCAQSIQYSLEGYPQPRATWFRRSVGPLAYAVFDTRGAMHHDLREPIPGAPALVAVDDVSGITQLRSALHRFAAHRGALAEHFAYGRLDHAGYTRAHLMHLAQHWSELAQG